MSSRSGQTPLTTREILTAIGQLEPVELEKVARHVSRLRQHKANGEEAALLQIACRRRPRAFQQRYHELMQKRQDETLTDEEYQELLSLTDKAEAFDMRRLKALATLAEMRQTDLDTLIRDLSLTLAGDRIWADLPDALTETRNVEQAAPTELQRTATFE